MASNVSQSVRDCLLNRTRETGEDHQVVLIRFALERLLYRMTQLPEGDDFALKGHSRFSFGLPVEHGPPNASRPTIGGPGVLVGAPSA
jgi:hypothetical protein